MKVMAHIQLNVELDIDENTEAEATELFYCLAPEELQEAISKAKYFDVYDSEVLSVEGGEA